ncbi:MAG: hypothetical protein ATN35_02405 [Epulopiscium sp. Nele67-Bin004]|nr:MAG: hypothetical protein ATN35_02405 [Epulopiscium sp. Nele67-Bin004]
MMIKLGLLSNDKGFTLLETLLSCILISSILVLTQKGYVGAVFSYNNQNANIMDSVATEDLYRFLKEEMDYATGVNFYVGSSATLVTYEDEIVDSPFNKVVYNLSSGIKQIDTIIASSGYYTIRYRTFGSSYNNLIVNNVKNVVVNKPANSLLITMSWQAEGYADEFFYVFDLGVKGEVNFNSV